MRIRDTVTCPTTGYAIALVQVTPPHRRIPPIDILLPVENPALLQLTSACFVALAV